MDKVFDEIVRKHFNARSIDAFWRKKMMKFCISVFDVIIYISCDMFSV